MLIARRAMLVQSVDMKYIDPSYQIRAVPTNCNDRIYCKVTGQRILSLSIGGSCLSMHALIGRNLHKATEAGVCNAEGRLCIACFTPAATCSSQIALSRPTQPSAAGMTGQGVLLFGSLAWGAVICLPCPSAVVHSFSS